MGLKEFFTKDVSPDRGPVEAVRCKKCRHLNSLPFLFCEECGSPRIKLGHWRIALNLTLTMAVFVSVYYTAEWFAWPWGLYALYSLFLVQIALGMVSEGRVRSGRFGLWYLAFIVLFGMVFQEYHTEGPGLFILVLRDLPEIAEESAHIFYPVLGAILAIAFLPLYFRWGRIYGWVNAYRIAVLSLFSLFSSSWLFLRGASIIESRDLIPSMGETLRDLVSEVNPQYEKILGILAVTVFRVFLFEIFVFSAVRGYAVTRHDYPQLDKEALKKESGLVKSMMFFTQVIRRFLFALEKMFRYLVDTFLHLAKDLYKVILAFLQEFLLPVVMLVSAAFLLHKGAFLTKSYIEVNTIPKIVGLLGVIVGLFACEMIFLGCKSKYKWKRVLEVHFQLVGWLLPNMLIFFLLMSFSLFASAKVMGDIGEGEELPFFIGLLTKALGGFLLFLFAVILYRKRNLLFAKKDPAVVATKESTTEQVQQSTPQAVETVEGESRKEALPASVARVINKASQPKKRQWDLGAPTGESAPPSEITNEGIATEPQEKASKIQRIGQFVSTATDALNKSQVGQSARKALGNVQEKLKGKPECMIRLVEVQLRYDEKMAQLQALDSTREAIGDKTYLEMNRQYALELEDLAKDVNICQASLDNEYTDEKVKQTTLLKEITKQEQELTDLERLHISKAVEDKTYRVKKSLLSTQLEFKKGALANHVKKIEFLEPYRRG